MLLLDNINDIGDTIVEVLIAVAVGGLVIITAFVGANHAFSDIEDAQSHQQALTIAQTQLEMLNASNLSSSVEASGNPFCFNPNTDQAMSLLNCEHFNKYPQDFTVLITYSSGNPIKTYTVNVTWPKEGSGNQTGGVRLYYQTGGAG